MLNRYESTVLSGTKMDNSDRGGLVNEEQPIFILLSFILLLTIAAQIGSLAFTSSFGGKDFQSIILPSILLLSLVTIPLAGLGIWLGRQIGLGMPLFAALFRNQLGSWKKLSEDAKIAITFGLVLGGLLVLVRILTKAYLPPELPAYGHRGVIGGLLVSVGAAIGEEVWFRLGLMTILVWSLMRLFGHQELRPSIVWTVVLVTSISFGLAHLPQLLSYGAGSTVGVVGTIFGNTIVGVFYGWCYWRRSLAAAILAHFSVDVAIHVIPAIVSKVG